MQELLQRDDLFDLVVAGKKQATVRKGKRDIVLGPMNIKATSSKRNCSVLVTNVEYVNEDHAKIDGYNSLADLKNTLVEIYGTLSDDQDMTVIYWN